MTESEGNVQSVEVCLPSMDLTADISFFTETLGFRLDTIFPADDPSVATVSGFGLTIRLQRGSTIEPGMVRLLCRETPMRFRRVPGNWSRLTALAS